MMKTMMRSIVLKTLGGVTATALTVAGIAVPMSVRSAQNAADASTALPLATEIAAEAETVKTDVPLSKVAVETGNMDIAVESAKDTLAQATDESAKDALAQTADNETTVSRTVGRAASYSGASGGRTENPSAVSNEEREKPAGNKAATEQSEKVAAEKAEAEKAAAEKAAAEKAAAEKAAAEKAAAEKAAAEKAAAEKAAAEKAEAERLAAEQAAKEEAERLEAAQAARDEMNSITIHGEESSIVLGGEQSEQQKVAHYHCNCGHSTTDYEGLKQHMFQHALNGDRNSYCTTYE